MVDTEALGVPLPLGYIYFDDYVQPSAIPDTSMVIKISSLTIPPSQTSLGKYIVSINGPFVIWPLDVIWLTQARIKKFHNEHPQYGRLLDLRFTNDSMLLTFTLNSHTKGPKEQAVVEQYLLNWLVINARRWKLRLASFSANLVLRIGCW
jgi:hypothetical protein